jgi:hypothetical protein
MATTVSRNSGISTRAAGKGNGIGSLVISVNASRVVAVVVIERSVLKNERVY